MTTIYLIRHGEALKDNFTNINNSDDKNEINKKLILSVKGEEEACKLSKINELNNIDFIYSSNYVRAMATAKYIAFNNKTSIFIDENFGERLVGIVNTNTIKTNEEYFKHQLDNPYYKFELGESSFEVGSRMYESLLNILEIHKDKRVVIVSHGASMTFLLNKLCQVEISDILTKTRKIKFNNKIIFEGPIRFLETFKLEFDGSTLVNIESVNR